ncbi:MAG: helix-turn-helix domain-containing protein [Victivallales bacterium]
MQKTGVQTFDRGLEILRLLALNRRMTASKLAKEIGIHQTSASRMLQSLQKAKLVYKPDFHSFAPDIGIFALGSIAMRSFPIVDRAIDTCVKLKMETGLEMAVGTLFEEKMFYFTASETKMTFYDSDFPVHISSIGLLLAHSMGKRTALRIIRASIKHSKYPGYEANHLYDMVDESLANHGFLYLRDFFDNKINCAIKFQLERGEAGLAIFSKQNYLSVEESGKILRNTLGKLADPASIS